MASVTVDTKLINVLYTGATTLTLNTTNTPWISNVIKLIRPSTSTGTNTRQSYNGSFGGATPGGAVTSLVPGTVYELTAGVTNNWVLPNFTRVPVENIIRLVGNFPASSTNTVLLSVDFPEQAGTYALPTTGSQVVSLTGISFSKGGSGVTGTVTLAQGDILAVTGTTASGVLGKITLIKQ